jgi:nucleotide-binding universal stress UspA family protein
MYEVTAAVPLYYPGLLDELKTDVGRHLQTVVTTSADGVDVECLVTAGTPHAEIVRIAKERQSELVVVGAHSHPALERIMFGSTTNHVVRRASCPVLTIRK